MDLVSANKSPDEKSYLLGALLKAVSRSFYLTLRVLPGDLREPIGLAYLLARAADTIADTKLIPPDRRLELLLSFRAQVNGPMQPEKIGEIENALGALQCDSSERTLLRSLRPALEILEELSEYDRSEVRAVVTTLTQGMEMDLRTFPTEDSGKLAALKTIQELDTYIFLVAGCVGEFWTKMTVAHTPAMREWPVAEMSACGIRFGKALQLTNVLRDCPKDLRIGRCYLPLELLDVHGLKPEDLLQPGNSARAIPIQRKLLEVALDHYREAGRYLLAIPPGCGRLRLACAWPILIGLATLQKLAANEAWLNPEKPSKVSRNFVYKTMALSLPAVKSDTIMNAWLERELGRVLPIVPSTATV